jgi:hypothetical protein
MVHARQISNRTVRTAMTLPRSSASLPAFALALLLGACGGPPPCARSAECGRGRVCGFEGTCAPLRPPEGARFAGTQWLRPLDWGVSGADERLDDTLPVGGRRDAESLLAFGPLPDGSHILRALLVLHPHEPGRPLLVPSEVVVEHVEPFRGGALPPRHAAQPLRFAAGRRALAEGPARPVRVDVTEAAKSAAGRDDRRLYLLLRARDGGPAPLRFASPWYARPESRPRLEVLTH